MTDHDTSMKTIHWNDTYQLGHGVDYKTGQVRASILEGDIVTKPSSTTSSQKVRSSLLRIETKEDLVDKLSVEVSGSGSVSTRRAAPRARSLAASSRRPR